LRNTLLGAHVTENIQLLLVVSTHSYFLSACAVETKVVFQHPASRLLKNEQNAL
jgi:acyl-CoA thioesterase